MSITYSLVKDRVMGLNRCIWFGRFSIKAAVFPILSKYLVSAFFFRNCMWKYIVTLYTLALACWLVNAASTCVVWYYLRNWKRTPTVYKSSLSSSYFVQAAQKAFIVCSCCKATLLIIGCLQQQRQRIWRNSW